MSELDNAATGVDDARFFDRVRLHELGPSNKAATLLGLGALLFAFVILIRPLDWSQIGGQQVLVDGLTVGRLSLLAAGFGLAVSVGLVCWAVLSDSRFAVRLLALPVSLLPVLICVNYQRIAAAMLGAKVVEGTPLIGKGVLLVAVVGGLVGWLASPISVGRALLSPDDEDAPSLAAGVCFLAAALPPIVLTLSLVIPGAGTVGVAATTGTQNVQSSLAFNLVYAPALLIYMVPVYAGLSLAGAADQAADRGRSLLRRSQPRVVWFVGALAVVKIVYSVLGFTGNLPTSLGGDRTWWGSRKSSPIDGNVFPTSVGNWVAALVVVVPLVVGGAIALRHRAERTTTSAAPADTPDVSLWAILLVVCASVTAVTQVVLQIVDLVKPGLLPARDSNPLYVSGTLSESITLVLFVGSAMVTMRRRPSIGAMFAAAALFTMFGLLRSGFDLDVPVPRLWHVDLGVSAVTLAVCLVPKWRGRWLPAVTVSNAALAIVLFGGAFLPDVAGRLGFGLFVVAMPLWYLFVRGTALRAAARTHPNMIPAFVGLPAIVGFVVWCTQVMKVNWVHIDAAGLVDRIGFSLTTVIVGPIVLAAALAANDAPETSP